LLGVSGGITAGYFMSAYNSVDPQCNILTRNTFNPLNRLLSRLGVVQNRGQTRSAEQADAILVETLQEGVPAMWSGPTPGACRTTVGRWRTGRVLPPAD
jgi:hypothetical protein